MSFEGAPQAIVVGVDYPVRDLDASQGVRYRDLTPTPDEAAMTRSGPVFAELGLARPPGGGGGPAFLRFLAEEAVPFIDGTYRTDSRDRTLVGLSLGGLFTLYALTERPALFNRYVAISPSLWWDRRVMIDRLKVLGHSPEVAAARLFVSVGLSEGDNPPYSMVGNVQALEKILRDRGDRGPTWHVQYFPEETHSSSWPGALSRGLRYAFGIWPQKSQD
jgi:predicted alpha/beta superfamily hydrolase